MKKLEDEGDDDERIEDARMDLGSIHGDPFWDSGWKRDQKRLRDTADY